MPEKCGICGATGFRQYEDVNNTHHYGYFSCGHAFDRMIKLRGDRHQGASVTSYNEETGEFSIDGVWPLARYEVSTSGKLNRFLAAFKGERSVKAAMAEVYEVKGLEGLLDLIDYITSGYWWRCGRVRARLLLLVLALVPIEGPNAAIMRHRIWEHAAPCGTPEIQKIQEYQSLQP